MRPKPAATTTTPDGPNEQPEQSSQRRAGVDLRPDQQHRAAVGDLQLGQQPVESAATAAATPELQQQVAPVGLFDALDDVVAIYLVFVVLFVEFIRPINKQLASLLTKSVPAELVEPLREQLEPVVAVWLTWPRSAAAATSARLASV